MKYNVLRIVHRNSPLIHYPNPLCLFTYPLQFQDAVDLVDPSHQILSLVHNRESLTMTDMDLPLRHTWLKGEWFKLNADKLSL